MDIGIRYNILKKMFSKYYNEKSVIYNFLGIKLKIKSNEAKLRKAVCDLEHSMGYLTDFLLHKIRKNSILIIEPNPCHGECLPGIVKYFSDLGFNIDVLLNEKEYDLKPLECIDKSIKINVFKTTQYTTKKIITLDLIKKYDYVYINSDLVHLENAHSFEYFNTVNIDKSKLIIMSHSPNSLNPPLGMHDKISWLVLAPFLSKNYPKLKYVNANYFGEIKSKEKNDITNFIVVGNILSQCKNFNLLIQAVKTLNRKKIKNFKVTVIARHGNLAIPKEILQYMDFKGTLTYPDLYKEMQEADFILPLLDSNNPKHKRYITCGTSGSFQLSYGFNKPCIIEKTFGDVHELNDKNSIIYNTSKDFSDAMQKAINMDNNDYNKLTGNLKKLQKKIYNNSLKNLKSVLKISDS